VRHTSLVGSPDCCIPGYRDAFLFSSAVRGWRTEKDQKQVFSFDFPRLASGRWPQVLPGGNFRRRGHLFLDFGRGRCTIPPILQGRCGLGRWVMPRTTRIETKTGTRSAGRSGIVTHGPHQNERFCVGLFPTLSLLGRSRSKEVCRFPTHPPHPLGSPPVSREEGVLSRRIRTMREDPSPHPRSASGRGWGEGFADALSDVHVSESPCQGTGVAPGDRREVP